MNSIAGLLDGYAPVFLPDLDGALLMDRNDIKFSFPVSSLPGIIDALKDKYYMLEINGIRAQRYESLYFDTPEFRFYTEHHNRKGNRYKVRFRRYTDSDIYFLEVKYKDNRDRTHKVRSMLNAHDYGAEKIHEEGMKFVRDNTACDPGRLDPVVYVFYKRVSLVHKHIDERVTLDWDISFRKGDTLQPLPGLSIGELKQDRISFSSDFIRVMRSLHIVDDNFSKYTIAAAMLCPGIKRNAFKPCFLTLNKITHGYA